MTTWRRVVGDTNDTIVATMNGVSSLAGVSSVEAHVSLNGANPATLTAVVTDSSARTVTVSLGSWITTATPGAWALEFQLTTAGNPLTIPEGTPDTIQVRAAIG